MLGKHDEQKRMLIDYQLSLDVQVQHQLDWLKKLRLIKEAHNLMRIENHS